MQEVISKTNVSEATDSKLDDTEKLVAILSAVYGKYHEDRPVLAEVIWEARRIAKSIGRRMRRLEAEVERLKSVVQ